MTEETRVVNKNKEPYDEYIGRGSVWGNPFTVQEYGRELCIEKYDRYIRKRLEEEPELVKELLGLKGKTLGCFCKPQACHGDILVLLIAEYGPVSETKKRCSNCGLHKPLSEFHRYVSNKPGQQYRSRDGYRNECKKCRNAKRLDYYYRKKAENNG